MIYRYVAKSRAKSINAVVKQIFPRDCALTTGRRSAGCRQYIRFALLSFSLSETKQPTLSFPSLSSLPPPPNMLLSDLILHSEKQVPSLRFALTVADLAPLTDPAHPVHPNELGGIDKICQGLRVDPTIGLYSDEADENSIGKKTDGVEFSARRKAFGSNVGHRLGKYSCYSRHETPN